MQAPESESGSSRAATKHFGAGSSAINLVSPEGIPPTPVKAAHMVTATSTDKTIHDTDGSESVALLTVQGRQSLEDKESDNHPPLTTAVVAGGTLTSPEPKTGTLKDPATAPFQFEFTRPGEPRPAPEEREAEIIFTSSLGDTRCGCFKFRPSLIQFFCKPGFVLTELSCIAFTHGFVINGCINVVLPTLERRFQLKSFESGMIISSYNVANCIAVAPVAFMGATRSKPLFVAVGVAVMGLGSLVFSLSHFIAPAYQYGSDTRDLCPASELPADLCAGGDIRNYRFLLMLGHAMHGIGTTPFYTLGVTYLDENLPTKRLPKYLGVYTALGVLGPGFGFMFAGYFLSKYVDLTKDVKALLRASRRKATRFSTEGRAPAATRWHWKLAGGHWCPAQKSRLCSPCSGGNGGV
ncbi:unnamed protein product [Ixodes hexagonus]